MPAQFWGECVITAIDLINNMPTRVLHGKTPHEILFKKQPTIDHLRVCICLCYAATLESRDKFGSQVTRCIFMGYRVLQKGYRLYDLVEHQFLISRDVVFHEEIFPFANVDPSSSPQLFSEDDALTLLDPLFTMIPALGTSQPESISIPDNNTTVIDTSPTETSPPVHTPDSPPKSLDPAPNLPVR